MDALLLGVLGAWVLGQEKLRKELQKNIYALYLLGLILGANLVLFSLSGFGNISKTLTPLGFTWIALFYLCLLIISLLTPHQVILRVLSWIPLRGIGVISYFLYLFHPVFNGVFHYYCFKALPTLSHTSGKIATLSAFFATILCACLSWVYLETPLIRWGKKWDYQPIEPSVVLSEAS
jgi:peptidoglycan/LPS O-acetylase OafA/YrhL